MGTKGSDRTTNCYIRSTFQSLVQAIIPPNPLTAKPVQVPGALEMKVYEYVIWILNHSISPFVKTKINTKSMARSTAELLDIGATQLIQTGQNVYPPQINYSKCRGPFSHLSLIDRLQSITLIERLEVNLEILSPPYQNNPALVCSMMDSINQLTLIGFYSEWAGYGTTRLFTPEFRRVEHFPLGWLQSNYPGPSFAYRDFRGFLALMPDEKGKD
ncbi:hypothetical protein [Neobacillus cucumis]|uniref:hypothetical protein n=1 Tax=Neobacillus cucumis TaxID=1740721 RepID=UPI002E1FA442|nr:hypothetical protein [Neobacillus cucumis]